MSNPATLTTSPPPLAARGYAAALQAASRRVTWQAVVATVAIAAALEVWLVYEFALSLAIPGQGAPAPAIQVYVSGAIINLVMAFTMMFATLVADELVVRGTQRRRAYPWAVVAGSAMAAFLQWELHRWLHLPTSSDAAGLPHEMSIMQPAAVFFEYLIWGSIIVFVYVNRRTALMASARMNLAQVEQARARRRTLESRLQALQARVEPQFLFNTLAKVRILYNDDRKKASRLLEDLTVYLRAALPQLRDSTSTLEQELKLVTAYLCIMRVHIGDRLTFDIDAPPTQVELAAKVPAMILLPLVDHVLIAGPEGAAGCRTVRLVARTVSGRLLVEIRAHGRDPAAAQREDALADIRERLRALYGDFGTLRLGSSVALDTVVLMEIPCESASGDHR
jgi:Histidine kinase